MKPKQLHFLGRFAKMPVYLHLSWPLFFILGVLALTLGPMAIIRPDWQPVLRLTYALALGLIMALSVMLHDAAHMVVAAILRLPVRQIHLYPFGGILQLQAVPIPAGPLVRTTLAGPIASLLQALFWLATGWLLQTPTLFWIAQFNLVICLVNLLPAAPLDGGRLLWLALGYLPKLENGTLITFFISSFLGLVTILSGGMALILGLMQFDLGTILGGTLFVISGIMIQKTTDQKAVVCNQIQQSWLQHSTVGAFLDQWELSGPAKASQFPSINFKPGFFSADAAGPDGPLSRLAGPASMVPIVHPHENLLTALLKLNKGQTRSLLVVSNGMIIGKLTKEQILKSLQRQKRHLTDNHKFSQLIKDNIKLIPTA